MQKARDKNNLIYLPWLLLLIFGSWTVWSIIHPDRFLGLNLDIAIRPNFLLQSLSVVSILKVFSAYFAIIILIFLSLPITNINPLKRILYSWGSIPLLWAVFGLIAWVLKINAFLIMGIGLLILLFFASWNIWNHGWRKLFCLRGISSSELSFLLVACCLFGAFGYFSSTVPYMGADDSFHSATARLVLRCAQFYLSDEGLPYQGPAIDVTASMQQAIHAALALLSREDILAAIPAMNTMTAVMMALAFYFFFRNIGFSAVLSFLSLFLLYICFDSLLDPHRLAFNRVQGYLIVLVSLLVVMDGFASGRKRRKFLILAAAIMASASAIHLARFCATYPLWIFAIFSLSAAKMLEEKKSNNNVALQNNPVTIDMAISVTLSVIICGLFALPRFTSIREAGQYNITTSRANMPNPFDIVTIEPQLWITIIAAILLIYFLSSRFQGMGISLRIKHIAIPLLFSLLVARVGIMYLGLIYPNLPNRMYLEPIFFINPLLLCLGTSITLYFMIKAVALRKLGGILISLLCIGLISPFLASQVNSSVEDLNSFIKRGNKVIQAPDRSVQHYEDLVKFLNANSQQGKPWPRVASQSDAMQVLAATCNVIPVANGEIPHASFKQIAESGFLLDLESLHLADASSFAQILLWSKRLEADYVLHLNSWWFTDAVDISNSEWSRRRFKYEAISGEKGKSAFTLYKCPTPLDSDFATPYNSRVFRFSYTPLIDNQSEDGPLVLAAKCGNAVLAFADESREWTQSWVYRYERNYTNWGTCELSKNSEIKGRRLTAKIEKRRRRYYIPEFPFRLSSIQPLGQQIQISVIDDRPGILYLDIWMGTSWKRIHEQNLQGTEKVVFFNAIFPEEGYTREARTFPRLKEDLGVRNGVKP